LTAFAFGLHSDRNVSLPDRHSTARPVGPRSTERHVDARGDLWARSTPCACSADRTSAYLDAARRLGTRLATDGIGLVDGGAAVGTMGALADAVLAAGGRVSSRTP